MCSKDGCPTGREEEERSIRSPVGVSLPGALDAVEAVLVATLLLLATTSPLAITRLFSSSERHLDGFVGEEEFVAAVGATLDNHGFREYGEALEGGKDVVGDE